MRTCGSAHWLAVVLATLHAAVAASRGATQIAIGHKLLAVVGRHIVRAGHGHAGPGWGALTGRLAVGKTVVTSSFAAMLCEHVVVSVAPQCMPSLVWGSLCSGLLCNFVA